MARRIVETVQCCKQLIATRAPCFRKAKADTDWSATTGPRSYNTIMPARSRTRREFLQGQSAADALVDAAGRLAEVTGGTAELPAPACGATYQIRIGRRAMACLFEVLLNAGEHEQGPEAGLQALN